AGLRDERPLRHVVDDGRRRARLLILMRELFRKFSDKTSALMGSSLAFAASLGAVVLWLFAGPAYHFSDSWQLVINTTTTIITFLMVFLIQNTQNREAKAVRLMLDELLRAVRSARNSLIEVEQLSDDELEQLQAQFEKLRQRSSRPRE